MKKEKSCKTCKHYRIETFPQGFCEECVSNNKKARHRFNKEKKPITQCKGYKKK